MSSGANMDFVEAAQGGAAKELNEEKILSKTDSDIDHKSDDLIGPNGEQYPTAEEMATLRRVYGKINWMIYIIGIVEMCERFAYYGTTAVCKCLHSSLSHRLS